MGAKTFCTKTKDNTVNPMLNEVFEVKILMGLWFLVHTSNIGYFISDCFVSDCLCEGLCGQLRKYGLVSLMKTKQLIMNLLKCTVSMHPNLN